MTARPSSALALLAGVPAYAATLDALWDAPRRWLVTGGAGFIGSHLTQALLELGQTVVVLDDLSTGRAANLQAVRRAVGPAAARLRFVRGDVRDADTLAVAADHADVVLHHAALVSVPESIAAPVATHEVNVGGFLQVLEVARRLGACVVYAASSASYGDDEAPAKREERLGRPLSMYAASKTADEAYAAAYHAAYGLRTIGLRYFNVFGARQDPHGAYAAVIPAWIAAKAQGRRCRIHGDGRTTRDFCHVANVVGAVLLASRSDDPWLLGRAVNVGTGTPTTLLELHDAIDAAVRARRPDLPAGPPEFGPFRPGDVRHSCADIARARSVLGYEPAVGLRDGIAATVDAILDRPAPRRLRGRTTAASPHGGPAAGRR
jgi:UDP-N-acetylglucosamine 4-epimerase